MEWLQINWGIWIKYLNLNNLNADVRGIIL